MNQSRIGIHTPETVFDSEKTKKTQVFENENSHDVSMTENVIGPNGAIELCQALKQNSTLTELDLTGGNMTTFQTKERNHMIH